MDNNTDKEIKIVFAEGCFDEFEGTQEELDALIQDIKGMVESGELFEQSIPLSKFDKDDAAVLRDFVPHNNTRQ
jgi:hypothetical protein